MFQQQQKSVAQAKISFLQLKKIISLLERMNKDTFLSNLKGDHLNLLQPRLALHVLLDS